MTYRVMLSGESILVKFDNGESLCGFVKNEYVWASSEEKAISKAKDRIIAKLRADSAIRLLDETGVVFTLDEIESGIAPWKLLSSEGFIFYKLDSK